jgi:hypothetical protein
MSKREQAPVAKPHPHHTGEVAAVAGEIVGAVIGSAAGPVGVVAGMVVGALAGTLVGAGLEADEEWARKHDQKLDEEIGITGGELGAVQPGPSPAARGASSADESSPDWPMQQLDADPMHPKRAS